jgi:hypothetical protein
MKSAVSGHDEREEKDGRQYRRPGRRNLQDRQNTVLDALQGRAKIDQIARRLGVRPETVVGRREAALADKEPALMRGDGPTERAREIERENGALCDALTRSAIQVERLQRPNVGSWGNPRPGPSSARTLLCTPARR